MSSPGLVKAIEDIGEGFARFKSANERRLGDVAETLEEVSGVLASQQERIEQIEAKADLPRAGSDGEQVSREQREYKGVFVEWMRNPADKVYEGRLSQAAHDLSKKDVSIGTPSAGGYAMPEQIRQAIEHRERQLNPFLQLVTVERSGTNDYKALVSMGDGTAGWSTETGTRSATNSPTLRERAPTMGEQYALPTTTNWALQDIFFDVQRWLVNEVAAEWSSQLATAIISGNGSARPTGILNTNPQETGDDASPMRAADVIEYVDLDSPTSPQSGTIDIDSLVTLVHQVKERYLQESDKVAFVMHRLTAAAIRKLKASDSGVYLWNDAVAGQPASLLGYRVLTCDAMPTLASNAFPVLFGNFARGYLLVMRSDMTVLADPYSTKGKTSFYCARRLGGCVLNNDAIKALRCED